MGSQSILDLLNIEEQMCEEMMRELALHLSGHHGVVVLYDDSVVPHKGVSVMGKFKGFIVIDPKLSTFERFLIMLHEIGHLFKLVGPVDQQRLKIRKTPARETAANMTACRLLAGITDIDAEDRLEMIQVFRDNYNLSNAPGIQDGTRVEFKPNIDRFARLIARHQ